MSKSQNRRQTIRDTEWGGCPGVHNSCIYVDINSIHMELFTGILVAARG